MVGDSNINRLSVINHHNFWHRKNDRQTNIAPTTLIWLRGRFSEKLDCMLKDKNQINTHMIFFIGP